MEKEDKKKTPQEGEIIGLLTIYNDDYSINCHEIRIHMISKPKLKLGKIKLIQEDDN